MAAQASVSEPLFTTPQGVEWEGNPNGTKFLFPVNGGDTAQSPFTVVLNWMPPLKK